MMTGAPLSPAASDYVEFGWQDESPEHTIAYLLQPILELAGELRPGTRVLDVGCGNGAMTGQFVQRGCDVVGIDLSEQGIAIARRAFPGARFEVLPADANVLEALGEPPFDLVISTEVVEHLYAPRGYAEGCLAALRPGGRLVVSTPYHGYVKNVAVALSGSFDRHVHPLRQGGHIKFWSRRTLAALLTDVGFVNLRFRGAGRLPMLWKSMVMSGDRPRH
jgi:2-polyprenyl-3-methyl-5-hydroxy-6-metoxy-1,4-benzoquinol methylase